MRRLRPPVSAAENMRRAARTYRDVKRGFLLYGRIPKRLRNPRRLAVGGLTLASLWFSILFAALAWRTWPASHPSSVAYAGAAGMGVVACALVLLRRARAGVATVAGMLALGQVVAVLPVVLALAR